MKSLWIRYTDSFPETPMTGWTVPRHRICVAGRTPSGQKQTATGRPAPFFTSRKRWARLGVHLDGIDMIFATPRKLDHFIDVMGRTPLPRGANLYPGSTRPGPPNRHWLSRPPAGGKSRRFRDRAVALLTSDHPVITDFRAFYARADDDARAGSDWRTTTAGAGTETDPYEVRP